MAEPRNASECQKRQGDRTGGGVHDRAGQGDKRQAVCNGKEGACEPPPWSSEGMGCSYPTWIDIAEPSLPTRPSSALPQFMEWLWLTSVFLTEAGPALVAVACDRHPGREGLLPSHLLVLFAWISGVSAAAPCAQGRPLFAASAWQEMSPQKKEIPSTLPGAK